MAYRTLAEEDQLASAVVVTGRVEIDLLGTSVESRPLRLWRVGAPPPEGRAPLLLTGTQHGNEGAGREALLDLIEDYANGNTSDAVEAFLETHGLWVMPTCNPDGVAVGERNNANNIDINRDHLALTQPESRAIAQVLLDARPAMGLDIHEGNTPEDAQLLHSTHPMVEGITAQRGQSLIAAIGDSFGTLGRTTGPWPGSDDERILRNMAGLRHTAGVVAECKSTGGEADRLAICRAAADAAVAYATVNADAAVTGADQSALNATARGQAATEALDLRVATVDPPPTDYRLTVAQTDQIGLQRGLHGITGRTLISLAQPAYAVIALLVDPDSEYHLVEGERVFPVDQGQIAPVLVPASPDLASQWYACDLVTGEKIARLHLMTGSWQRALGAYTQDSLTLPVPLSGLGSLGPLLYQSTDIPRVMIVNILHGVPAWGGIPLRVAGGTGATVGLGCVSIEGYLNRRFVGEHQWSQADQAEIAAGLVADAQTEGINLTIDAPDTGVLRDRTYHADEGARVYKRLQELMDVSGGPEWTIDLQWGDEGQTWVEKIFRLRPRIGRSDPVVTVRSVGATSYTWTLDWSDGMGANHVVAYSSGEGDAKPTSVPARDDFALSAGTPRFERRWQPSSSIKDPEVLDEHAVSELARIGKGTKTLELEARWQVEPGWWGINMHLGDTIAYDLKGHMHPVGISGTARIVGVRLDPQSGLMSPTLIVES